ncbi:MAG TPA: hypothetical protein VFS00_14970, partial [Polyangiaceae bacterium]|nr:hypothetical protein [Polyangiaceae bacterium]
MSRRTTLVFGLPLFVALFHCNALLGIEDASVVEGPGGAAGEGGVSGVGGGGGTGGATAGRGGAGTGGRGGEAGADPGVKVQVAAGAEHTCAWVQGGKAYCWGDHLYGQLGNGGPLGKSAGPVPVLDAKGVPLTGFRQLDLGGRHTCALRDDETVLCWGLNGQGQAAADPALVSQALEPTPLRDTDGVNPLQNVKQIALGDAHGCALLDNGSVACWGDNAFGQLGRGEGPASYVAKIVLDDVGEVLSGVQDIAAGDFFSCARTAAGTLYCWGSNNFGQIGAAFPLGAIAYNATPYFDSSSNGIQNATAFALGGFHACAIFAGGRVRCWGSDESGQLGNGPGTGGAAGAAGAGGAVPRLAAVDPVKVLDATGAELTGALSLSLGAQHSCALLAGGVARCWGRNGSGELGDGTVDVTPGARP